jgi:2-keto-4-pentenoate hydratase/2-oxohepta-3-ene-1,7-dioic acid hydratase in catechol pathway
MKYANIVHAGRKQLGIGIGDRIIPMDIFQQVVGHYYAGIQGISELLDNSDLESRLISDFKTHNKKLFGVALKEDEVAFRPCAENPGKVVCIGLNYRKHAQETNMKIPETPVIFSKFSDTIAANDDEVPIPEVSNKIDYEGELAILIGKRAFNVTKESALDHVFGYFVANDISARDLQFLNGQWLLGKASPKFTPVGPYVVTGDEVGNPNDLDIRTTLNGEIRQDSNTSDMVFSCDYLIHYISKHFPLEPGDVILTGTPEGVILGYPPEKQVWVKHGDEVIIEIEKLGKLRNTFVSASNKT